jgi:hypothetical protein
MFSMAVCQITSRVVLKYSCDTKFRMPLILCHSIVG